MSFQAAAWVQSTTTYSKPSETCSYKLDKIALSSAFINALGSTPWTWRRAQSVWFTRGKVFWVYALLSVLSLTKQLNSWARSTHSDRQLTFVFQNLNDTTEFPRHFTKPSQTCPNLVCTATTVDLGNAHLLIIFFLATVESAFVVESWMNLFDMIIDLYGICRFALSYSNSHSFS